MGKESALGTKNKGKGRGGDKGSSVQEARKGGMSAGAGAVRAAGES